MNGKSLFIFVAGCATGFGISYFFLKKKFDEATTLTLSDIRGRGEEKKDQKVENAPTEDQWFKSVGQREKTIDYSAKYRSSSEDKRTEEKMAKEDHNKTIVISEEEFESDDGYETISLIYYADKVLADERDNVVDVALTVGKNGLAGIDRDGEEVVYLKNDQKHLYYEVTRDNKTYSEVTGRTSSDDRED